MNGRVIQGLRTLNIVLMAAIALVLLLLARQCFFEKEDVLSKLRSTLSDEDLKNLLAGARPFVLFVCLFVCWPGNQ
jgi:hypothetical protein